MEDEKRMKNEITAMRKNKKREKMTNDENGIMVGKGRKRQKVCDIDIVKENVNDEKNEIDEKCVTNNEKVVESYVEKGGEMSKEKMMNY